MISCLVKQHGNMSSFVCRLSPILYTLHGLHCMESIEVIGAFSKVAWLELRMQQTQTELNIFSITQTKSRSFQFESALRYVRKGDREGEEDCRKRRRNKTIQYLTLADALQVSLGLKMQVSFRKVGFTRSRYQVTTWQPHRSPSDRNVRILINFIRTQFVGEDNSAQHAIVADTAPPVFLCLFASYSKFFLPSYC